MLTFTDVCTRMPIARYINPFNQTRNVVICLLYRDLLSTRMCTLSPRASGIETLTSHPRRPIPVGHQSASCLLKAKGSEIPGK